MRNTKDINIINRFLRERGLSRSFKIYSRLADKRKYTAETNLPNYDQTYRRQKVYLVSRKGRTYIYDFNTLKILGSSRLSIRKTYKKINQRYIQEKTYNIGSIKTNLKRDIYGFHLKDRIESRSYNPLTQKTRHSVITNRSIRKKVGFVVVDATFKGGKGVKSIRLIRRSYGGLVLNEKSEVNKGIESAIKNALHDVPFSPEEIIINDYWFEYYFDTK